jgi:hypothetical protein
MRGLYNKYEIWNNEKGKWMDNPAFVVKLKDPHGRVAVRAYADSCKSENPDLAADLQAWLDETFGSVAPPVLAPKEKT